MRADDASHGVHRRGTTDVFGMMGDANSYWMDRIEKGLPMTGDGRSTT